MQRSTGRISYEDNKKRNTKSSGDEKWDGYNGGEFLDQ